MRARANEGLVDLPLVRRVSEDRRRGDALWALGIAAYCALIAAFFPSVRDSEAFASALDDYPEPVRELLGDAALDLTSGPGFFHAEVFSIVAPLLFSIVAIGAGASLAGDERVGLMDLVLANDLSRGRYVGERAVSMVLTVLRLALAMVVALAIADLLVESDIGLRPLVMAVVASTVFALVFGAVALLVAAQTGDRSVAVGAAVLAFTLAYVASAAAELVDAAEPLRSVSPYYWLVARSPLLGDGAPIAIVAWCGFVLAAVWVSSQRLERRDLG